MPARHRVGTLGSSVVHDATKQAEYAAKRSALRGADARFKTLRYRIYRPGYPPIVEAYIGPSQVCALYPDLLRLEVVGSEPVEKSITRTVSVSWTLTLTLTLYS